jgi:hypothetical protein
MFFQSSQPPVIVTLLPKETEGTSWGDVIVGAFGLTGALVLLAVVLGAAMAFVLVQWNKRHRPEEDHMPTITS